MTAPIPFLDLSDDYERYGEAWRAAIAGSAARGSWILGEQVDGFEREAAAFIGCDHAIGVANGTDALVLALRAFDIGPGDEVITTPFTFFATAEAISLVGATPVFADIEYESFNLDPRAVADRITARTRAIIAVHLFGRAADMRALRTLANTHGLRLIEDAAQAFGARTGAGRVGSLGDIGCFSFYPTKILGAWGDGGLVSTGDGELAARIRRLRNHGASAPFVHDAIGANSRLDEIQAALLRSKLRSVDAAIAARRRVATAYSDRLCGSGIVTPGDVPDGAHVFNLYTVRADERDAVQARMGQAGIACRVCYSLPLHLQPVYRSLGYASGSLPEAEQAARECLSLPIWPGMSEAQVARVAECLLPAL